ncbi:integrase catalytic domain-containing protein [Shewanella mangrovisoli]|uniref:integrase catalytic domain-containing protein n=1 Tax=Shewanella mangrovisoli TaxID=2864211 RepID=UPI00370C0F8C
MTEPLKLAINRVLGLSEALQAALLEDDRSYYVGDQKFDEDYLVVHITQFDIFLINIDKTPRFPQRFSYSLIFDAIQRSEIEVLEMQWEPQVYLPLEGLAEKKRLKALSRFDIIAPLVRDLNDTLCNSYGDELFQKIITATGRSKQYVYDTFNAYLYYGQRIAALALPIGRCINHIPKAVRRIWVKQGRPNEKAARGKKLNEYDYESFLKAKRLYSRRNGPTLTAAFKQMTRKYYFATRTRNDTRLARQTGRTYKVTLLPPTERPSYNQFYYWMQKQYDGKLPKRDKSQKNPTEFRKDLAGRTGDADINIISFGQVFEIDETPFDTELVSVFDKSRSTRIGKATLYFVIDKFTKYIVGLYITTESPSYKTVRQALFNACRDKTQFLEELGLNPQAFKWSFSGVPLILLVDNAEFRNRISEGALTDLQTIVKFARAGRGDDKPNIEQLFNVFREYFQGQSSLQSKSLADIAKQLARRHASLTIRELYIIAAVYANYHNNARLIPNYQMERAMIQDNVKPIPAELCKWCSMYRPGFTVHYSDAELYLKLLEKGEVSIHQQGIHFLGTGLWYNCEWTLEQGFQDQRTSRNKVPSFPCRYNANFVDFIFIDTDAGLKVATLDHKFRAFSGLSFHEVKAQLQQQSHEADEWSDVQLESQLGVYQLMEDIFQHAQNEKAVSAIPDLAKINDNRQFESLLNRFSDVNRLIQSSAQYFLPPSTPEQDDDTSNDEFYEDD